MNKKKCTMYIKMLYKKIESKTFTFAYQSDFSSYLYFDIPSTS